MSDINEISQYYNLYDSTKNYTELLFRAGKVLQSKEVNELQSMIKNQIKNVGDTILTDGDIIEGCQLVIDGNNVTLTNGRIYLNGNVRKISDTSLTITGEGTEVIGAILKQEVITPDDDDDLLEVASGYDNYNQDGAYRLKESVTITLNNPEASVLYTLIDGQQMSLNTSEDLTQLDKMNATLARRTYDESGNYKVNGLKLVDKNHSDASHIYISLEPGKAYVKGYEVTKTLAQSVPLDRATDLRYVENEPKTYVTGTTRYSLINNYIKDINKVVSVVQVTQSITRGSIIGGIDYLPLSPVVSISSVKQGGTTYTQGTDFQLLQNGVDWSIGNKAPDPGSSYTVTWSYNKTMIKNTDYTLYKPESETGIGYIEFTTNGDKPVNGSSFLVNYSFSLCRRDAISLDKDGRVIVTKGQSDILRTVESPATDEENVLTLGSVLLVPDTDNLSIINNNTQTIPMLDLYKMLQRINDLEYNQSITDLDNEAATGESATELIGVFTDGFIGLTKADIYHSEWDASVDLDNQELTLPFETGLTSLIVDQVNDFNMGLFNRIMTAPYNEINLLSQSLATGGLRVNSYNAFPKTPSVKLSPEVDNWIDEKTVTIQGETKSSTISLRRWWYHKSEYWAQEEKALWQSYGFADGGESLGWNSGQATVTKTVTNSVLDSLILYMRQRSVNLTVENLQPLSDNIMATFDGIQIKLSASTSAYKGSVDGTLRADATGKTVGHFEIPANTLCGTRELKVYAANTPSLVGSATYTANGRTRTTTKTVWTEKVTVRPSDPLAQAFQFETDQMITGVGVYFLDKDTNEPITVQIRNMVNGYPGTTVYAEKVINGSNVKVSPQATQETKIVFDDPVYCNANQQYCFTILSNSDIDSIWIAETTKTDITSKTQVSKNPYLNGTLFSSSNALTWTAHQSADMKFNIYGAQFKTEGHAVFQAIQGVNFDRLMITSEESIPAGCSIKWQYSINNNNNGEWLPIETYDDRDLSDVAESVKFKVTIQANSYASPAIALDSLMLVGFKSRTKGVYISKNVYVEDGYNHVKQVIDLHVPSGTNVNMYYATDVSGDTWHSLESTSSVQKSANYKTYTFEGDVGSTVKNYRCKVELTTNNSINRPTAQNLRSIMKTV